MITRVTLTGADDSVTHSRLIELSKEFPFVEWGILFSTEKARPRFPSFNWLYKLQFVMEELEGKKPALSLHLCGNPVRNLVSGVGDPEDQFGKLWDIFDRVQLNFHSIPHNHTEGMIEIFKRYPNKQWIFQFDDVNNHIIEEAVQAGCTNVSALFDRSGGAGILPDEWPECRKEFPCGYAGGLSPANITDQIYRISQKSDGHKIWIDAETWVRSDQDKIFDLDLVRQFLKNSEPFVGA